jgi:cholesterol transport system auxiliary component
MKYFIISLLVLLFGGCISTVVPPMSEYRLNPKIQKGYLDATGCKDKSIKVAQAFSLKSLMSKDMSYANGGVKQFVYSESQWSVAPNRAITAEFLKMIRDTKLFKSVQISKSRSRNDYILEINIEDFMQYFYKNASTSYSKVLVTLTLIDTKTNSVVASQTFDSEVKLESLDAVGGVKGLNQALSDILQRGSFWLNEVCR